MFYDILERKNNFLGYKNELQKVEKLNFFHGLGPKLALFSTFVFGNICKKNVFYDILERKNNFLGYENKKLKKPKNKDFSKGFGP